MQETNENTDSWWGSYVVPHDTCHRWQLGPLTLWIERLPGEWRIARESGDDAMSTTVERGGLAPGENLLEHDTLSRFGVSGEGETLILTPALADLPVVTTPRRPFYIPADEEVTVYVGTPLWMQVITGEKKTWLDEFPVHRPSDTWFGPNTQQGELCYASRSFCRLQLEALLRTPHRATTAVLIQNHASTPLYLDRMKLPVPYLSLFSDATSAELWTNDVVLERLQDEELAPLRVRDGAPASMPSATRVAEPRNHSVENIMVRAFGSLFADWSGNP